MGPGCQLLANVPRRQVPRQLFDQNGLGPLIVLYQGVINSFYRIEHEEEQMSRWESVMA